MQYVLIRLNSDGDVEKVQFERGLASWIRQYGLNKPAAKRMIEGRQPSVQDRDGNVWVGYQFTKGNL